MDWINGFQGFKIHENWRKKEEEDDEEKRQWSGIYRVTAVISPWFFFSDLIIVSSVFSDFF